MKYSEKLRDPRWQKKRLEIMARDNFTCQICFDTTSTLNVHHKVYVQDVEPWDCIPETLVTLCETCHVGEQEAEGHGRTLLGLGYALGGFLWSTPMVEHLTQALAHHKFKGCRYRAAEIIRWALTDEKMCELMREKYCETLPKPGGETKHG